MTARATVSYTVEFGTPPRTEAATERPGRVLRVARLLAFAHQIEARVRGGEYADLADAARKLGLTRARITQIVNLTLLAPEIQEVILAWPRVATGRDPVTERTLRAIVAGAVWSRQLSSWDDRKISRGSSTTRIGTQANGHVAASDYRTIPATRPGVEQDIARLRREEERRTP